MSKITKKELRQLCKDNETAIARLESILKENGIERQPKLKKLDLSVFDGLDEKWRFAAVGKNGSVYKFRFTPKVSGDSYFCDEGYHKYSLVGTGYDASNWQNSLIERDTAKELLEVDLSSELTGSELCKAMLARGDKYVMCLLSDMSHAGALSSSIPRIITNFIDDMGFIEDPKDLYWHFAVPINNQGEPLTAAEAEF